MRYKRYVVAQNDTLELLAQTYLGDMSRAAEIARLNHLRYPFIADDPQARLATPLGTTTLASALLNGQVLAVQHADPAIFPDGGLVLLRGVGGVQGQPYWDVLTILGTARGVGGQGPVFSPGLSGKTVFAGVPLAPGDNVVIDGGLAHAYAQGSTVWGYPSQTGVLSWVAKTGDTLLLPLSAGTSQTLSATEGDLVAALGVDLQLTNGLLTLSDGAITTVAGVQNMVQALTIRLGTRPGELAAEADYGNAALAIVGQGGSDVGVRIYAAFIDALLADPRAARVTNLNVIRTGDVIGVNASVALRDRDTVVSVNNLVLNQPTTA